MGSSRDANLQHTVTPRKAAPGVKPASSQPDPKQWALFKRHPDRAERAPNSGGGVDFPAEKKRR